MKDILVRAAKTFVQALTGALTIQLLIAGDTNAIRAAAVGAASAAASVLWNAASKWANS